MKRELAITGIALVVSILLSSPSVAQTKPANATPAPAPVVAAERAPALEELSLDDAILMATSHEDRMRLLMRCAGPPPKVAAEMAALPPASEPVILQ